MTIDDIIRGIVREELAALKGATPVAAAAPAAEPQRRGPGRPPKAQTPAPAAPAAAPAAPEPADPFAAPSGATPPTATIDEVRNALTALKGATSQENALKVLKDAGGADNLPSLAKEKYGAVVAAATAAMPGKPEEPADDPFAAAPAPTATPKALTIEDVRNACVDAQKRSGADRAQKVVMEHGGQMPDPATGGMKPALKALPVEKYAVVIAALQALPTTK